MGPPDPPDPTLALVLGRISDLQQQIAVLHDEVQALCAIVGQQAAEPPTTFTGTVDLGWFGQRSVTLFGGARVSARPPRQT